ncbi:dihydrodipicolinate synthase family protein [Leptothrix discophora]|uniref:Dihydrodipicolinate synthase family protein n=1 Tax=Leptothrix discophora TaxID=89 RepID=A0ABT9G2U9_LEPDI|nr:dihydrodipicolinate synthase family protein [Leptothrix discophora]MDP4300816.1 dihydrodipicolinate synthase family protein [Leptothrix discophora]
MPNGFRLKGLVPATFTPMKEDGQIDLTKIPAIVDRLQGHGAGGLFVCGTTGEGASLSMAERMLTLEAHVGAADRRLPVIAHVAHTSLVEARELAAHAQRAGAAAISALPPFYFKPATLEQLVASMAEIASAAPELPFYYYHIPGFTGVSLDLVEFLRQAADRIPNLAGVKYTAPTLYEFQSCAAVLDGRFDLVFGVDEMLLAGLATGAQGAVGSTYNLAPRLYQAVMTHALAGNLAEARRLQLLSAHMVEAVKRYRPLPALKAMMAFIGHDCGPTRLPLQAMSATEKLALHRELDDIGFLEWMA